jgi:hypothetical protein
MSDPIVTTNFLINLIDRVVRMWGWLSRRLRGKDRGSPADIRLVPQRHMWNMARISNEPAMSLMSDWWLTNNTETSIFILRAELRFRHRLRAKVTNQIQLMKEVRSRAMGEVRLLFWIVPPVCTEDQDFNAHVIMIDNFNRRHDAGNMTFKSPRTRKFPD